MRIPCAIETLGAVAPALWNLPLATQYAASNPAIVDAGPAYAAADGRRGWRQVHPRTRALEMAPSLVTALRACIGTRREHARPSRSMSGHRVANLCTSVLTVPRTGSLGPHSPHTPRCVSGRLVFSEELARPLTLTRHPYHFCAIKGYSGLAAFMHRRGLSYPDFAKSIRVAAFMGAGVEGSTPWEKGFDVSPADAALLAGVLYPPPPPLQSSRTARWTRSTRATGGKVSVPAS